MKRSVFCVLLVCSFCSCKNSWDNDDKQAFYGDCLEEANTWAGSQDKAKAYCDCVMERMMNKFPNETDALEHIDSVINDPDINSCKTDAMRR